MRLRSFREGRREFFFIHEEMRGRWRSGAAVALVDRHCMCEMLFGGVTQVLRFVQEHDGLQRTFRQFEKRTLAALFGGAEERGCFPGGPHGMQGRLRCADQGGDVPFGERQESCALNGRDRALRARVKFTHRFDGVPE